MLITIARKHLQVTRHRTSLNHIALAVRPAGFALHRARCREQLRKDRLCQCLVRRYINNLKQHFTDFIVANNFWGKDDAGVQPLLERMQNAKVTCDELKGFYNSQEA